MSVMPVCRWDTPTDASAATIAHRPLSSCDVQQWRHWLACLLLDVVLPWFTRSSSATTTIRCSLYYLRQRIVTTDHDSLRRLTVKAPNVQQGYRPATTHIRLFYDMPSILLRHLFSKAWIHNSRTKFNLAVLYSSKGTLMYHNIWMGMMCGHLYKSFIYFSYVVFPFPPI